MIGTFFAPFNAVSSHILQKNIPQWNFALQISAQLASYAFSLSVPSCSSAEMLFRDLRDIFFADTSTSTGVPSFPVPPPSADRFLFSPLSCIFG